METYTLLDARGFFLKDYKGSQYKTVRCASGEMIPAWQDGLSAWLEKTLFPLLQDTAPRTIIACFDGGNTLREGVYAGYKSARKAARAKAPPEEKKEVSQLLEQGQRLLAYLGVRCVHVPGEEADDLIALFAEKLPPAGHPVIIRTIDEDLIQLVGEGVTVVRDGQVYSALEGFGVPNKYGIPHRHIRLRKSIVGDTSDTFGGIAGAGPKFFEELATLGPEWLDWLDQIIALDRPEDLKIESVQQALGKKADKLYTHFNEWKLGYFLAGLHPECCYGEHKGAPKLPQWYVRVPSQQKVNEVLQAISWGHRTAEVMSKIGRYLPRQSGITAASAQLLVDSMPAILASPIVSYDFESTDRLQHAPFREDNPDFVDVLSQEITGISVNYGTNLENTLYVSFDHKDTDNLPKDWARWLLSNLNQRTLPTVVQNAAFELSVAKTDLELDLKAPFDTQIMAVYADENLESHLKDLSMGWLRYRQATYKEVTGGRPMHELTLDEVLSYGCDDALVTSHLFDVFRLIMLLEGTWDFYCTDEVEPVLEDVQTFIDGTDIDLTLMKRLEVEAEEAVETAKASIHADLAEYVNQLPQDEAATRASMLLQEWWILAQLKYAGRPDEANAAYQALWQKAWKLCYYQPPTTVRTGSDWVATPQQLNRLITAIAPTAPLVEKVSVKAVEAWWAETKEVLSRMQEALATSSNREAGQQALWHLSELGARLHGARRNLTAGKRKCPEYQSLEEYANHLLDHYGLNKTALVGDALNFRSSDQMQGLLYGKLGLPLRRRSKVAHNSTREKHKLPGAPATGLKAVAAALVRDVAEEGDWRMPVLKNYREVCLKQQEASLYYVKYPRLIHPRDGRLHPQIKNCGTVTRRPSGTAPNDLQVSKKDDAKIRKCYVGGNYGDGPRVYVAADFANQELVFTACESKDPVMLEAFMSNPRRDIHSVTSTGFAHILMPRNGFEVKGPLDYDTFYDYLHHGEESAKIAAKEVRRVSKSVNFLMVYGGGPTTLAEDLLIPLDLAKELIGGSFNLYARLRPWQQEVIEFARIHGYTQTAYGNRRHATKDLWSADDGKRMRMERQVVNAVIQGGAADLLKVVRQEMHRRKMRERYALRAMKPVYDELSASVPLDRAAEYAEELVEVMTITPPGYPVGMKVDLSIGWTWGSVREIGSDRKSISDAVDNLSLDYVARTTIGA